MSELWTSLGGAVLHFLWQGALVGLFTALGLTALRGRGPAERHGFAFGALALAFVLFLGTFARALLAGSSGTPVELPAVADVLPALEERGGVAGPGLPSLAAWAWALGFSLMSLRLALQCRAVRRLKTVAVRAPEAGLAERFERLRTRLGVDRGVRLLASGLAEVPMVVGWLKPVVLVPAAALTGLGPDQLGALLAHELAHVRRRDPWFNAFQAVVETVLFFHPVIWWISRQVRVEREYCCDDSSLAITGSRRLLAEALAAMESLRPETPHCTQTVLGAHGGPLMQRIARILGAELAPRPFPVAWQVPAGLALAGLLALGGGVWAAPAQTEKPREKAPQKLEVKQRSEHERKLREELEQAVLHGRLTRQEADEKLHHEVMRIDFEEQARRMRDKLAKGVTEGHLTPEGAERAFAEWQAQHTVELRLHEESVRVREKLRRAVAAGELTEAEAEERLEAWQREIHDRDQAREMKEVWAALRAAVDAGQMSEVEAKKRFQDLKDKKANLLIKHEDDPEAFIKRIAAAVEAGRLTPAEGKAKIEAYREDRAKRLAARQAFERASVEIDEAVAAGRLTREEAKDRLARLHRSLFPDENVKERVGLELREIEEALKAGKISEEEARKRREELRKKMADVSKDDLHKQRQVQEPRHEKQDR